MPSISSNHPSTILSSVLSRKRPKSIPPQYTSQSPPNFFWENFKQIKRKSKMGAQGRTNSSPISMQRVKLYRLSGDGKWDDKGTGHVTVDYMERSEDLGLFVIGEETNETLLAHRIRSDDAYRRQEDTIISWQDQVDTSEVALSFQETTGCAYIWDQICTVQRNMQFSALGDIEIGPRPAMETLETSRTSHANDDTFHGVSSELRELPGVELSTLPLILKTVVEGGIADQMRVTELILHDQDFFPKLMDLFRICDDLDDLDGLHMIFKLVKGIILLNSSHIFEKIFGDEFIMDIIGCLEYDPDVSQIQHHRSFLKEHVVFKEAIPIKDPVVLSKIHQTYRVGYIKDVILPRVLDETTIANLNSIVHSNNALVVSLLKDDSTFIQELFARMRSSTTSAESKKNLVFFLHEFCGLSKSLQVVQQLRLFRDLMNEGIFDIITDALHTQDKRLVLTGTDILILFLNQDPNLLRSYITRAEGIPLLGLLPLDAGGSRERSSLRRGEHTLICPKDLKVNLLLNDLVKGMITDFGEDMHCQFLEILRSLLDSYTFSGSQRDTIIEMFYDKHLDQLIDVIVLSCPPKAIAQSSEKSMTSDGIVQHQPVTKPEILSNICELLCFCVLHHPYRIKCKFLLNNAIEKILFLTRRREKYIVVAAVRFLRTVISRNDEQLVLHIVKNNLLKPIVEAFVRNGNRYNLLNSAVLELFEYIRKENLKTLVIYLVDSLWNQLARFEYLATIHALKIKYDQYIESCQTRSGILAVDPRRRNDDRAPEKEEEEYFNEDSDEEDTASARASQTTNQVAARPIFANGTSLSYPALRPGSCGLVDYDDDDDDEDYNPPPRTKPETSTRDERIKSSSPKLKRVSSSNEGLELTKKRRIERTSSEDAVTVGTTSSACNRAASSAVRKATTSLCSSISNPPEEEKCNTDEENHSDKSSEVSKSCSNCLPNTTDTRQSSGENGQLLTPNGSNSSEMTAVNGSSVTGSEPYSVR